MAKRGIYTNMIGRRVRPGGYAKPLTAEEIKRTEDDGTTDEQRANWLTYTNKEREKTRQDQWGKGERGEIVNVYMEDGSPKYTVVMEDGSIRELWGTFLEVELD